ncbi:GGDEF domain-containing protein [Marinobacter panjinensis]|uniref:diguanylate cyclase n=1 Tax=Marinobacter panjinensis TaxID=2576384 RepID=A0A4U6R6C2_9GAMM|nr:GGDEF domain-containing protein [Marinobacter panjinensis]MCR8914668.1 GGDEF domain-containing protein [Marinobacter panjinensis]TKV68518.1 GGDEF domain-containing protein [Marinobacter panjinensis]
MKLSGPAIPEKWQPAYEAHLQALESKVAVVAAWLLLITVFIYQFSHPLRNVHSSELLGIEFLLRLPVILTSSMTLVGHYLGGFRWPSRYFLRLMGLSVMAMILSMLLLYLKTGTSGLYQISNGLVISFFGVSVLAVRGIKEWALLFLLPLGLFAGAAASLGIAFTDILPLFFDPLMMMLIGIIVMEALRRVLTSEFEARQTLGEMAATDQLTGLLNRRAIWPLLNHELQHAQRAGTPFSLILGDLDLFKKVNDVFGHDAGDLVLQETARRLEGALRRQDALCRWGGEELLILLPDTDSAGAQEAAEKLRASMADSTIAAGDNRIHQTISLGVASFQNGDDIDAVVSRADEALYRAKHKGRNRVEIAGSADAMPAVSD